MRSFLALLTSGLVQHRPTSTLLGGPYGLKWPVLVVARAFRCMTELDAGRKPGYELPHYTVPADERAAVQEAGVWLINAITHSVSQLPLLRVERDGLEIGAIKVPPAFRPATRWTPPFEMVSYFDTMRPTLTS